MRKNLFIYIFAVMGVAGFAYAYPIYAAAISNLSFKQAVIVNSFLLILYVNAYFFVKFGLSLIKQEIYYRRSGDIKIDGELHEDFILSDKYFAKEN